MTTVVNNPAPVQDKGDGGGTGFLIGAVILVAFVAALLYFAIPAIKNMGPLQVNVPTPQINIPAPQVNVQAPAVPTTPAQ
jgi:hypothetical protein